MQYRVVILRKKSRGMRKNEMGDTNFVKVVGTL